MRHRAVSTRRNVSRHSAPLRAAPLRVAPHRFALSQLASRRLSSLCAASHCSALPQPASLHTAHAAAPHRFVSACLTLLRLASARFAQSRSALPQPASRNPAPLRLTPLRFAFGMFPKRTNLVFKTRLCINLYFVNQCLCLTIRVRSAMFLGKDKQCRSHLSNVAPI